MWLSLLIPTLVLAAAHLGRGYPLNDCCSTLTGVLGSKVAYPNSTIYDAATAYWAEQQDVVAPSCIVKPADAHDVSIALVSLVAESCKFAVRSGGHSSTKGVSTIEDGITIDMRGLDHISLSNDSTIATIGGGQTWGNVYSTLYEAGVTVPGGRNAGIGVSGSTIGGALGYIATLVGFGSDSIIEYEVVLADGTIVTASQETNSDLWKSLKGGGSNFGLLTKIVARTTPIGKVWTSSSSYDSVAKDDVIQALSDFTADPNYDPKANLLGNYLYTPAGGLQLANLYTYAAPVEKPEAYADFYPIEGQVGNVSAITTLPEYSVEQDGTSPDGFQQITFATSFDNNIQQLQDVWTVFNESVQAIADVPSVSWALTLEPLPTVLAEASKARGGNVVGLDVPPEGTILVLGSFSFDATAEFAPIETVAEKLLNDIIAASKKNGVFNPYIDLNHAFRKQNPFKGYGDDNYALLLETAEKYDPQGIFQTLMPGGFKLQ